MLSKFKHDKVKEKQFNSNSEDQMKWEMNEYRLIRRKGLGSGIFETEPSVVQGCLRLTA